jgi:hypothetical protein
MYISKKQLSEFEHSRPSHPHHDGPNSNLPSYILFTGWICGVSSNFPFFMCQLPVKLCIGREHIISTVSVPYKALFSRLTEHA